MGSSPSFLQVRLQFRDLMEIHSGSGMLTTDVVWAGLQQESSLGGVPLGSKTKCLRAFL